MKAAHMDAAEAAHRCIWRHEWPNGHVRLWRSWGLANISRISDALLTKCQLYKSFKGCIFIQAWAVLETILALEKLIVLTTNIAHLSIFVHHLWIFNSKFILWIWTQICHQFFALCSTNFGFKAFSNWPLGKFYKLIFGSGPQISTRVDCFLFTTAR